MKEIKELSNCCKSEVKIGGDDKEGTHYYICTKCNKPCDLYSEIRELSDEELLESCLNLYAIINNPTVSYPNEKEKEDFRNSLFLKKQELLRRLSKENWKKELTTTFTNIAIDKFDKGEERGIMTFSEIKNVINNLE